MVGRKLLTLAGIAGILACGACYLPMLPERPKPEPPPPLTRSAIKRVQNIRVDVDVSHAPSSLHLNYSALAQSVAEAINKQSWMKVNAHAGWEGGEDAVLEIYILQENVKADSMTFLVEDSAVLRRVDDTAYVWQETEVWNWIPYKINNKNRTDIWKTPGLADSVNKSLSDKLAFRMFYLRMPQ